MAKWFLMLTVLVMGEIFICFGLMAQQNQCSQHLVQTFHGMGRFALYFAGAIFAVCSVSLLVGVRRRLHAYSQRSTQERARLRQTAHWTVEGNDQRSS
jgi:hypothetical protein